MIIDSSNANHKISDSPFENCTDRGWVDNQKGWVAQPCQYLYQSIGEKPNFKTPDILNSFKKGRIKAFHPHKYKDQKNINGKGYDPNEFSVINPSLCEKCAKDLLERENNINKNHLLTESNYLNILNQDIFKEVYVTILCFSKSDKIWEVFDPEQTGILLKLKYSSFIKHSFYSGIPKNCRANKVTLPVYYSNNHLR